MCFSTENYILCCISADSCRFRNVLKRVCLFLNPTWTLSAPSTTSRWQYVFNPGLPVLSNHTVGHGLVPAAFHHVSRANNPKWIWLCLSRFFYWLLVHIWTHSSHHWIHPKPIMCRNPGAHLSSLPSWIFPDRPLHQAAGGLPFAGGWRVYFCFCVMPFLVHPTRDYMTPYRGGKINYVNDHI